MAELEPVGYQHLIEQTWNHGFGRFRRAYLDDSVNQKVRGHNGFCYPRKAAVEQTLIRHVEFALRTKVVSLEVLEAVFEHLAEVELLRRWSGSPNSAFVWKGMRAARNFVTGRATLPALRRDRGSPFPAPHAHRRC
ncbi:hypothetical protein [Paraburkholderia nodosa]|uniref:hypothetical protein n=1 Tax=Paraburkholderia nodosa TaxID=392320 RepID=UPI0004874320|nr:hypothetical protein [Paraburkholderia nodosa]